MEFKKTATDFCFHYARNSFSTFLYSKYISQEKNGNVFLHTLLYLALYTDEIYCQRFLHTLLYLALYTASNHLYNFIIVAVATGLLRVRLVLLLFLWLRF